MECILLFLFYIDDFHDCTKCPPKRPCLGTVDLNVSSSPVRTHCPISVAENSEEIRVGGLMSSDSLRNDGCLDENENLTENIGNYFMSDSPLCPVELLVYSLMRTQFKTSTFNKHHTIEQYTRIVEAVSKICGVQFDASSLRRLFPRISKDELKKIGKKSGKVRWNYYSAQVEEFLRVSGEELEGVLSGSAALSEEIIVTAGEQLKKICSMDTVYSENLLPKDFADQFNNIIRKQLGSSSNWIPWCNLEKNQCCLFNFGSSPGYAEKEIRLSETFEWKLFLNGKEQDTSNCQLFCDIPTNIGTTELLVRLISIIDNNKTECEGSGEAKNFQLLMNDSGESIYKTKDGKSAVYIENEVIRSRNCHLFLPKGLTRCSECKKSHHYLRTLLSRTKTKKNALQPKKARLDYKSKNELLGIARQSAAELKVLKTKNKRLESYIDNMVELGPESNDDLRRMFNDLYDGMMDNRERQRSPVCLWQNCTEPTVYEDVEELYRHSKTHIEHIDTSQVAPIDRRYECRWRGCTKNYSKLKLLENHLREHTGNMNDGFLEILLCDQAKAIATECRQMRWHPAVIRWCLRIYLKSHKLYEDLRNSGGLKLPSGRTLSDYNNYCSPQTGWKTDNLKVMREQFQKKKPPKHARLGGLYFDEMKIKEGLVFNTKNWELVGFTDILENDGIDTETKSSAQATDHLATHVLQFFFRSTFFNFDYPCAFFLTKNITALQLNRLFWLGVSMLHTFGFEIILSCCDGASSNRSFIEMNTGKSNRCSCFNPFSGKQLFFFSDPPHLIKKLRNNLHSSGHKSEHARYTRTLILNDNCILWNHVYAVFQRESKRHLYATDIRKAHVTIDSISKMRVKLAVQTLSEKVAKEMEECDNVNTKETRTYIRTCDTFWNIFNNPDPIRAPDDERILKLNKTLEYFTNWEKWLGRKYSTKQEQGKHFISWQTMSDLKVRSANMSISTGAFRNCDIASYFLIYSIAIEYKNSLSDFESPLMKTHSRYCNIS